MNSRHLEIPTTAEVDSLADLFSYESQGQGRSLCQNPKLDLDAYGEVTKARISSKTNPDYYQTLSYNPNGECGGSKSDWEHLLEGYSMTGRASF